MVHLEFFRSDLPVLSTLHSFVRALSVSLLSKTLVRVVVVFPTNTSFFVGAVWIEELGRS